MALGYQVETSSWPTIALIALVLLSSVSQSASYDVGKSFKYHYVTAVILNEPDAVRGKNVTYQVVADVAATSVWQNPSNERENLLLIQVHNPSLQVVPKGSNVLSNHISHLDSFKEGSVALHLREGKIEALYSSSEKNDFLNLKGGIASLFQFQTKNGEQVEVDSSGKCTAVYHSNGKVVHKTKKDCIPIISDKQEHKVHPNKVFGVDVTSKRESTYELNKEHMISSVESSDVQLIALNIYQKVGAYISAKQQLTLTGSDDGSKLSVTSKSVLEAVKALSSVLGASLVPSAFHWSGKGSETGSCDTQLPDYVRKRHSALKIENLAKLGAASTFLDLVQRFRACDKMVLAKIFNSSKNKNILPQLLDIAAAAQTNSAFESVLKVLSFDSDSIDLPERFLCVISTVPYPSSDMVLQLVDLVKQGRKNEKLFETLLLTVGAVTKTYHQQHGNDRVVEQVLTVLLDKLKECREETCKLQFLRALRNAALPGSLPALIEQVKSGGKVSAGAVLAIQAMPAVHLSPEIPKLLLQAYHQVHKKHDSTARIVAAEILLDNFPCAELLDALLVTPDNSSEVKTYVLAKIFHKAETDLAFRDILRQVLRNPRIGNYDVLAQGGDSTMFTHLLAGDEKANATYGLRLELISGGLMKRSNFDVGLHVDNRSLNAFTFGLFAAGLRGIAGGEPTEDDDLEEDVTAGIAMNVLDVDLRPYTLFTGQGELMGHVWSGTGSEVTPIFQGNFLLHDHHQTVALQNGFVLRLNVLSALSFDMTGSVQTSLWNRNAHTAIVDKAAIVMQSTVHVDSSYVRSHVGVNAGGEAGLEFIVDADFADTPKMCTQMIQPAFSIRRTVSKVENIPGSKHKLRRVRLILETIPGRSFELNRRNTELCSVMLGSQ